MNVPATIDSFSGEWDFLSNFYPAEIWLDEIAYASVEHAYQAAKTADLEKRRIFQIEFNPRLTAARAKRIGRKMKPIRKDWDQIRTGIMLGLLGQKFGPTHMLQKLLSTMKAELIEGNWWHDDFWGVCYGGQPEGFRGHFCDRGPHEPVGENYLGKLLMQVRGIQ